IEHSTTRQHLCRIDSFVNRNPQLLKPVKLYSVSLEQFVGRIRTQGKLLFCEFHVARSSSFVDVCDAKMVEQNIQRARRIIL
ncbi:MAG: hypothetical protein RL679_1474, partial [Bacteroidota bacterium]